MGANGTISAGCRRESLAKVDMPTRKEKILAALEAGPEDGMTAREVMQALGYTDMNSVRPRLSDLDREGKVIQAGKREDVLTGINTTVYKIVAK